MLGLRSGDLRIQVGTRVWVVGFRVGDFGLRFSLGLARGISGLTWGSEPDLASLRGFGHGDIAKNHGNAELNPSRVAFLFLSFKFF